MTVQNDLEETLSLNRGFSGSRRLREFYSLDPVTKAERVPWMAYRLGMKEQRPAGPSTLGEIAIIESRMRADAIRHLIEEGKWLSGARINEQGGYSPSNPAEPASRWKRKGKAFAINFKGQDLFAAYQFDKNMKPRAVIAEVLKIFRHREDAWTVAAWFASVNGWLRGKRPQDCLDEPALVIEAARQEVSGFEG